MIKSREQLKYYLAADRFMLGKSGKPRFFGDEIWKFQILLRKCEYYSNAKIFGKLLYLWYKIRRKKLGLILGFDIPEGVFDAGLRLNHFGNIVVNGSCRVGRWCEIHQGVNIGASNPVERKSSENYVPKIGCNVWIGPGVKIYGNIEIGNGVQIGANAVVGSSFYDNITIAGVPAKIVKNIGTNGVDVAASIKRTKNFFLEYPEFEKYR